MNYAPAEWISDMTKTTSYQESKKEWNIYAKKKSAERHYDK
jgi:hypothetical protein